MDASGAETENATAHVEDSIASREIPCRGHRLDLSRATAHLFAAGRGPLYTMLARTVKFCYTTLIRSPAAEIVCRAPPVFALRDAFAVASVRGFWIVSSLASISPSLKVFFHFFLLFPYQES